MDARDNAESLELIFAFVWEILQENERGAPRRRILLSSTVGRYSESENGIRAFEREAFIEHF